MSGPAIKAIFQKPRNGTGLYKDFVLQMLTAQISSQIRVYKQFMAQDQDEDLVRVLDRKNPPPMLGNKKFISWIKDRFFKKKLYKEVPASKQLAPDLG